MSQYTAEYVHEKLKKELDPIHLVRSTVLKSNRSFTYHLIFITAGIGITQMNSLQ